MPSGTTLVNELDSIYNEVLVEAFNGWAEIHDFSIILKMITEQGDDAVMDVTSNYTDSKVLTLVERGYK